MATRQEILDSTRAKYPEYNSIPDDELAIGLASKYPVYAADLGLAQSSSIVPRGGFEYPVSPEVAKAFAGQRVYERALEAGQAPPQIGPTGEIIEPGLTSDILASIEGIGRGVSLGASDIPAVLLGGNLKDPNLPRNQSPQALAWSEFTGSLLPTSIVGRALVAPGQRLAQKVIGGGLTAAPAGAVALTSEGIVEKGRETTLNDIIENTLKGGIGGFALGGALPLGATALSKTITGAGSLVKGLLSPVKSLENLGVLKSAESRAVAILNPKGNDVREVAEDVTSGRILKPFQEVRAQGAFNDGPSFIENANKALKVKSDAIEDLIKKNPDRRFNGSDAADLMVAQVSSDPLISQRNPGVIDLITSNSNILRKDLSLREGFDLLNSINKRHENYFSATQRSQNTRELDAEFATDEVMRKFLSRKLNDVTEGLSGKAENPFREYGAINEVKHKVTKEWNNVIVDRLKQVDRGLAEEYLTKFDISKPATWVGPVGFLKGGELGAFNKRISSLNKILPKKEAARILTPEERLSKLEGTDPIYSGPIPPTIQQQRNLEMAQSVRPSSQAVPISPDTLEAIIAQDIMAASPMRAPLVQPSFAPPNAAQSQELLQRAIQDAMEADAVRAAGSNMGFF